MGLVLAAILVAGDSEAAEEPKSAKTAAAVATSQPMVKGLIYTPSRKMISLTFEKKPIAVTKARMELWAVPPQSNAGPSGLLWSGTATLDAPDGKQTIVIGGPDNPLPSGGPFTVTVKDGTTELALVAACQIVNVDRLPTLLDTRVSLERAPTVWALANPEWGRNRARERVARTRYAAIYEVFPYGGDRGVRNPSAFDGLVDQDARRALEREMQRRVSPMPVWSAEEQAKRLLVLRDSVRRAIDNDIESAQPQLQDGVYFLSKTDMTNSATSLNWARIGYGVMGVVDEAVKGFIMIHFPTKALRVNAIVADANDTVDLSDPPRDVALSQTVLEKHYNVIPPYTGGNTWDGHNFFLGVSANKFGDKTTEIADNTTFVVGFGIPLTPYGDGVAGLTFTSAGRHIAGRLAYGVTLHPTILDKFIKNLGGGAQ